MTDRGDFLKDCGDFLKTVARLARAPLSVLSNCKQRTFWQAAALTAHALSLAPTNTCVCTTKGTEGITSQICMQQLLNRVFILQSQQSAPRKLHIDQNYCTIKA